MPRIPYRTPRFDIPEPLNPVREGENRLIEPLPYRQYGINRPEELVLRTAFDMYAEQTPRRTTQQITKVVPKMYFDFDSEIDEAIGDYCYITLYEGTNVIGKLFTEASTPYVHFISRHEEIGIIETPNPCYTIYNLLPELIDKLSLHEHIEQLMVEVYKTETQDWKRNAYLNNGFTTVYENRKKYIMLYDFER